MCLDAANKRSYPGAGTTWTDRVGEYDGTLTNGPTFSNDNGGSIVFDGSNDYVQMTSSSGALNFSNILLDVGLKPLVRNQSRLFLLKLARFLLVTMDGYL